MRKAHRHLGLGAALALVAGGLLAVATPTVAGAAPHVTTPSACTVGPRVMVAGHSFAGIVPAATDACQDPAFMGNPPLLFNGRPPTANCVPGAGFCDDGNVMSTRATGPLVITPIFWQPEGYGFAPGYVNLIESYIHDVAAASGQLTNVYSVLTEYYGNNGIIQYRFRAGPNIIDTNPLPEAGCDLTNADKTGIYSDGTGYSTCLSDAQLQTEINAVTAANGLPHNLSHIYELFLPKAVESCFNPGQTLTNAGGQFCTINHEPTAAYCAYHSIDTNAAIYANLAYPIYASPVGYTCGTDARFPVIQAPNGNADADTEISPTSHEISEAITDPDTQTGWYDAAGNEIGDDCAYVFGRTRGAPGGFFNQVINGGTYITQEEFSNKLFASSGGTAGCLLYE